MRSTLSAVFCLAAFSLAAQDSTDRLLAVLELRGEGAYERALADAKELAAERPDLGVIHRAIVDLYLRLNAVEAARSYFESDPDSPYAQYGLARLDVHEGDLDGAIDKLKRSITLEPTFAEPYGLDGGLPGVYEAKTDLDGAVAYFEALVAASPENANALAGLGWSYARSFQFDKAIGILLNAIELDPHLTQAYRGLVQSYFRTGRFQKGLQYCEALRRAAKHHGDFEMLAYAWMMQGTMASFIGDYRTAHGYLHEALQLAREIGDRREATVVNNSAIVYAMAGDLGKALEYFEASLELSRSDGDRSSEPNALGNIGSVHKQAGRYDEAIRYYREAAALERKAGSKTQLCSTLVNMAEAFQLRGDADEALRYYNEALTMAKEVQNASVEAYAVGSLGRLSRDRGDYAEAIAHFDRALAIGEQNGEIQAVWEAQAGLGSTYEKQSEVEKAIRHYAEAIALYDSVRADLAIESLGSSFLEDKYEAYPSIVQLLAGQGAFEEAFAYTEKFKAKGFLDILAQGQTLFETHLPEDLLLELEQIRSTLQENHAELSRERSRAVTDPPTIVKLEERIGELGRRKASVLDTVRNEHGDFYQLAISEPLDVKSLQASVLEPGEILVEYLMGDERLSIFVVSRHELHYREVPVGRDELRRQLSELSPLFEDDGVFNSELADFSLPPARALYDTLLGPIEELLTDSAELIIVPDDFLFYLPFETLVVESRDAEHRYDFSAATFVVERYAVSYSPSASLLDPRLRRPRQSGKGVLAFGNPTFDGVVDDQPPLPNAEEEVEAIRGAFDGYENSVFTGDAATETVFKREAENYGVLHFATHFLSDDRQPLYSRIVLAGNDGTGDDGVLQTYEIFDTKLNAELAVLSACSTGLGQLRKGEGLIGISRAFLYAGVPSLVVSLWSVDDKATARIMELFYRHLRSGVSKKQALRQAKLDYLDGSPVDKKDPFYWAPFILSGDWQPLDLPTRRPLGPPWLVGAIVVLSLIAAGRYLRTSSRFRA